MNPAHNFNEANGHSRVGVQAGVVHGEITVNQFGADADPKEIFEAGVRSLESGMPSQARNLIDRAVSAGLTGSHVGFHWVLARLSGRTRRELSAEDLEALRRAPDRFPFTGNDKWTQGLAMVKRLIETPEADLQRVTDDFDHLEEQLRDSILRHLDMFLTGPIRDGLWERRVRQMRTGVRAGWREQRAWKFFQADPIAPQPAVPVAAPTFTATERNLSRVLLVMAALTTAGLGVLLLLVPRAADLISYVVAIAAAVIGARPAAEWHHFAARHRKTDRVIMPMYLPPVPPADEYTDRMHARLAHFFTANPPANLTPDAWRNQAAGVETRLCWWMTERFRGSSIPAESLDRLAEVLARRTRDRWASGELFAHQPRSVTLRVKATAAWSTAVFILAAPVALVGALRNSFGIGFLLAITTAVLCAIGLWMAYQMRFGPGDAAEDALLAGTEYEEQYIEYLMGVVLLSDLPSEREMAVWLGHDMVGLMERVLRHYKLSASDVLTHALISLPVAKTRRARYPSGPWRYSRYHFLLLVLTIDGVRQVSAEVDTHTGHLRLNGSSEYRFEAIASTHSVLHGNAGRRFNLRLLSGEEISIQVRAPESPDHDEERATQLTMDSSGVGHTLHVLQGVSAEGKQWIALDESRDRTKMAVLKESLAAMTS